MILLKSKKLKNVENPKSEVSPRHFAAWGKEPTHLQKGLPSMGRNVESSFSRKGSCVPCKGIRTLWEDRACCVAENISVLPAKEMTRRSS